MPAGQVNASAKNGSQQLPACTVQGVRRWVAQPPPPKHAGTACTKTGGGQATMQLNHACGNAAQVPEQSIIRRDGCRGLASAAPASVQRHEARGHLHQLRAELRLTASVAPRQRTHVDVGTVVVALSLRPSQESSVVGARPVACTGQVLAGTGAHGAWQSPGEVKLLPALGPWHFKATALPMTSWKRGTTASYRASPPGFSPLSRARRVF